MIPVVSPEQMAAINAAAPEPVDMLIKRAGAAPAQDAEAVGGCWLIEDEDIAALPVGTGATHKWNAAVLVVAGSPGMEGAAYLSCAAAMRSGARIVHLNAPPNVRAPLEVVRTDPPLRTEGRRFHACAVGPGLGRDDTAFRRLLQALELDLPTVIDADAIRLVASPDLAEMLQHRRRHAIPTVVTPHDGEFQALTGKPPGKDRVAEARSLTATLGATVLLKGGPTVVADPDGQTMIVANGDHRLATAGTGDVLTGMIAGRLAAFGDPSRTLRTVAEAAHLHAQAAATVPGARLVAGDLLPALQSVTP